jgi:predicted metal-dependent hydrolase
MMAALLLLSSVPSQYCRDLPDGERLLCGQLHEARESIKSIDDKLGALLQHATVQQIKTQAIEVALAKQEAKIESLETSRDRSDGERRTDVAAAAGGAGALFASINILTAHMRNKRIRRRDHDG